MPVKFIDALRFTDYCQRMLGLDLHVALVAIIDKRGRIMELRIKENASLPLDEKEMEMLFMQRALQSTMIKESDEKLGIFNYTLTVRGRFCEYARSLNDMMLLVLIDSVSSLSGMMAIIEKLNRIYLSPDALSTLA